MIDGQWLTREKVECTKHSSNSLWWDLVNEIFRELQASRLQTEDALKLDTESRNAVAVLQDRLNKYEQRSVRIWVDQ